MSEPTRPCSSPHDATDADALEELVAEALEAAPGAREALLAGLDPLRAQRVRRRLAALGELGLDVDGPARATGLPERFGPYLRGERVGGGGMGEVFLARDERDGSLAALKLVRPDHLWFGAARARFRREVAASAGLEHPGIVRVLAVGEELDVPWLALEWVGGVSLGEVLERLRGIPPESLDGGAFEDAVRAACAAKACSEPARERAFTGPSHAAVVAAVAARVARALAHAHSRGVLHRDVKPSNVLVTPAGRVLLVDFGLALPRDADRMTRTGHWLGSLPYAAPEQVDGSPRDLDQRADVYGLGATLYELVTLRTPFLGGPESLVRRRIASGDLEAPRRLNPAVPRPLERIVQSALDIDPARRPSGADALADLIDDALAGRSVRVRGVPPWSRLRRWLRKRPKLAFVSAALALVVVGSLAVALRERALAGRLERLGDAELVRGLEEEARAFWPASTERVGDMQGWLERAEELCARAPEHRHALDALRARALPYSAADRARDQEGARDELTALARELDGLEAFVDKGDRSAPPDPPGPAEVRARDAALHAVLAEGPERLLALLRGRVADLRERMRDDPRIWRADVQQLDDFERLLDRADGELRQRATFRFADALDAWQHESLCRLLADLESLAALVSRVRDQRASTQVLHTRFAGVGAGEWERARAAIHEEPRYGGLELEPSFELQPLGPDPASGLWEFLLLGSGAAPERDARGGWRMAADTGVVLVLLPGGRFRMGQRADEGPRLVSALPQHEVELAPFFLARHELSAGQAERLGGFPAERRPPEDGRLPLVIDWERARACLLRHGLELPTEAQWEYAARAGGAEAARLEGYANVSDLSRLGGLREEGQGPHEGTVAEFDDGYPGLAPIGSFLPNGFGLHDLLGNVSEWCLDAHVSRGYSTLHPRAGDGLRATVVSAQLRVARGGSFTDGPDVCRAPARTSDAPGKMPYAIGVRPARALAR